MEKHSFWLMSTKLNIAFFAVGGGFFTTIAIGIADNRFEHDMIIYVLLSAVWMIVILNLISLKIIKKHIQHKTNISMAHKLLISITMVGVVVILFSSPQYLGDVPYHQPNKEDVLSDES